MSDLSYDARLLAAAAGKIPAAVIHQGDGSRVYLVFNDEVGRAEDPLPILTEFDWHRIPGVTPLTDAQTTILDGGFSSVMTLASIVPLIWPSAHVLFTPCSCCVPLENFRVCYRSGERCIGGRRVA